MLDEKSFLADVANHIMTILRDEELYRHLRFRKPGCGDKGFDLVTWPGHLCYTGDMGTYVFSRLPDMFQFFRTDREYASRRGRELAVNFSYWAEKVLADDRHCKVEAFNEERFNRAILERLVSWMRESRGDTTKTQRRELWEAVVDQVLTLSDDDNGTRRLAAAHDFSHRLDKHVTFYFEDLFDSRFTEYTSHFCWCCYALAWGIQQYDAHQEQADHAASKASCAT